MKRIRYSLNCLLFLCCWLFALDAQIKPSIHFTEDDGLPGNIVRDLVKDKEGILWVATENGVTKFDGDKFTSVNTNTGLPLQKAWAITCGDDNEIYVGLYERGLAIIRDDSVINIIQTGNPGQDRIRRLFYSSFFKKLIIGTDLGLFILKDTILVPVYYPKENPDRSVVLAISGQDSLIFFSVADYGIYKLHLNNSDLDKVFARRISSKIGSYSCLINGDTLYGGLYNNISRFDAKNPVIQYFQSKIDPSLFIWNYSSYKEGKFLIGGYGDGRFLGNVIVYDPKENYSTHLAIKQNYQTVNSILYDNVSNVIWLARDNGLTAVFDSPFSYFEFAKNETIIDIGFARDSLLVLTENGIFYPQGNKMVPVLSKEQIMSKINHWFNQYTGDPAKKSHLIFDHSHYSELVSFQQNGKGLFISTQRGALSVPDLKTYLPFAAGIIRQVNDNSAYSFINYDSLRYYPSLKDSLGWIIPDGPGGKVSGITEIIESKGIYYCISPLRGLYALKNNIVYELSEDNSTLDNYLTGIDKDENGNLWCSSANCKLFEVGFSDSLFIKRGIDLRNSGLIGNSCKWIKFNGDYLLIGTNKGLNIISYKGLYSEQPIIEHFYNSFNGYDFISADSPISNGKDKIYLHTFHEVIAIDTNLRSPPKWRIYISNLLINGSNAPTDRLASNNLTYHQKQVSFIFKAIKYPLSRNIKYRYKINEGDWIEGNQVVLQSLRPGNYKILYEGRDDEDMSTNSNVLLFTVKPPFWNAGWFILLSAIALSLVIILLVRIRINQLKKQHEEKTRLITSNSELQLRSLQIQMNPHFIFNALTAIQSFIINKNTEESLKYLGELASIIRTNLENASEEYICLSSEIMFLKKYVEIEKLRFDNKLQVEFHNNIKDLNAMIPPMLIQPIIENSIKHGIRGKIGKGIINIDFNYVGNIFTVIVEDNGVGRIPVKTFENDGHNGKGLKIINQRLNLLNKLYQTDQHNLTILDLYDDGIPTGTRVIIKLIPKLS